MSTNCGCANKIEKTKCDSGCGFKKIACANKCSHDPNKLLDMLESVKLLYSRVSKDICQYTSELEKFQDYYQRYDLNQDDMLNVMEKRYNGLAKMLYLSIKNHLSFTTNVRGIGEKIIKPTRPEYGTQTTLKYQNVSKTCSDCNDCLSKLEKCYSKDREIGCRNFMKVQLTTSIATYDNMDIIKLLTEVENVGNQVKGYSLQIGKLLYTINNTRVLSLKETVDEPVYDGNDDPLDTTIEEDKITANSVATLFDFIDNEVKNLGDIQTALNTNIEYVEKYIRKFRNNACC